MKLRYTTTASWHGELDETYFPPKALRRRPHWFDELVSKGDGDTDSAADLLNEIYVGIQNGLRRSPMLAARALFEQVMQGKVGDKGTFRSNVEALEQAGFVSKIQRDRLLAVLEAGHAAMHRDFVPELDNLIAVLDIAEHLVESLYVHDRKVSRLASVVPPRPRR
ncbi:DUF4145 domain-containing protein [Ideonella alba]|uniref:DUF4145 domain-containing protein n=1 Tax=Ideonella alba TaxID=2824118 RepID=A0A940YJQ6_9BURK|nr:DUF4145 domain-containing protein [Ideonella alba]MBQ0933657.1 DUF4145 domain-containing protein [Ideonella alba]